MAFLVGESLLPPLTWVHFTVGLLGALIMVYTFMERVLKEQLLVSEVLAGTAVGVLVGPAVGRVFDTRNWYSTEDLWFEFLQEVMRLALAIQLVSAALELPQKYFDIRWRSMLIVLGPVLICSWISTFVIAIICFPHLGVLTCLTIAACLTPTDPVLSSTVVQGEFAARHLPASLRYMLTAESGANDGVAFPFVLLPLIIARKPNGIVGMAYAFAEWGWKVWLYQVGLATLLGLLFGAFARSLQVISSKYSLQNDPSFLAHIIGLAFGSVGLVRSMGADGVLAVFVSGVAFSYRESTAEEGWYDAINGIELILTLCFFTLFGAVLPVSDWSEIGISRLLIFSILVLLFRRLPIFLGFCRFLPELQKEGGGWRSSYYQAAFAGFFGPMGVGALFYTTLVQEESGSTTPFVIVSFVVLASILVHGTTAAPLTRLLKWGLNRAKREADLSIPPSAGDGVLPEGLEAPLLADESLDHVVVDGH